MESRPIEFHPQAKQEYLGALSWYGDRSRVAAARFESEFQRALDKVVESPARSPIYFEDIRRFSLQRFPFSIFYRTDPARIYVVAVAHARRRPNYWGERL
jgi:toxin ParE1/3/4